MIEMAKADRQGPGVGGHVDGVRGRQARDTPLARRIFAAGYKSIAEFAGALYMAQNAVSQYSLGNKQPKLETALRIAELLDLTLDDLKELFCKGQYGW